jgi:hypothetical protein
MRDLATGLVICQAFDTLLLDRNLKGRTVDLRGSQSVLVALAWQQSGEGHSAENSFQVILEEGDSPDDMNPAGGHAFAHPGLKAPVLVHNEQASKGIRHLVAGYYGKARYIRMSAEITGKSETFFSGVFVLGHLAHAPCADDRQGG